MENKTINQQQTNKKLKDQVNSLKKAKKDLENEVKPLKIKKDKNKNVKDKNDILNRPISTEVVKISILVSEACDKSIESKATQEDNFEAKTSNNQKFCTHSKQCIARLPKPPLHTKWKNGGGLTVLLPNQAFKKAIKNYEADFGDHFCQDCNSEWICFETGNFYCVRSCGNNLVKFENESWWNGEGNFKSRDQQMFRILVDIA